MGSKRTKKIKQELEVVTENGTMKNESETLEPNINSVPIENSVTPAVIPDTIPKAVTPKPPLKRKQKSEGTEVPKKVRKPNNESDTKKVKVKKRRTKSLGGENQENRQLNGANKIVKKSKDTPEKKREAHMWPDQDLSELINRMESNLPPQDILAFKARVEKLNWDNVAFKNYTAETCKKMWQQVQKKIRRYRLLREILQDAKEWIKTPRTNTKLPRPKKHPDMPRRPLSSYLLFYVTKKDEIISENPGLDASDLSKVVGQIYKNLPPETREPYEKLAATNREEYFEKLKLFFENHPELTPPQRLMSMNNHKDEKPVIVVKPAEKEQLKPPLSDKVPKAKERKQRSDKDKPRKPRSDKNKPRKPQGERKSQGDKKPGRPPRSPRSENAERPPKKFQTPFGFYYASQMGNMEPGVEKSTFREKCKQQYRQMPDKDKVHWINLAEQDLVRYQEEVKAYKASHPGFKPQQIRSVLTKREKISKERAAGKPVKPPNSAYALYSKVMLQSDEIKPIHPKDRMNYIAVKWKTVPEEEQNQYRDQVVVLMTTYRQEYQNYVNSLSEEEKRKLIQLDKRKKGRSGRSSGNRNRRPRTRKPSAPRVQPPKKNKEKPTEPPPTEPPPPPRSACKYFVSLYKGDDDPIQAWKALPTEEKQKYEQELVLKKQVYIAEFEKFLKSLSKEQLEAFSEARQQQLQSEEESSDCSSGSEGDDEDEEEDDAEEGNEVNGEVPTNENEARGSESD